MNLGNPREMTILEFADAIRKAAQVDRPIEFQPACPRTIRSAVSPISPRRARSWDGNRKCSLEDGILETFEYFRSRIAKQATPTL